MSSFALDLTPLKRHRNFRLLYLGQSVSFVGSMMTYVALPYHMYQLTKSTAAVGMIGMTQLVPLVLTGLVGGTLADRLDRRRLIVYAELGLMLVSILLAAFAYWGGTRHLILYVASGAMAALNGIHRPSLESLTPRLVDREEIPAMSALSSLRASLGMIGGPALGGVIIASFGLQTAYIVDVVSFFVSLIALASLRDLPEVPRDTDAKEEPKLSIVNAMRDGLSYAMSRQVLVGTYVIDIFAMAFATVTPLTPAIADRLGGAQYLGLLYAAPSAGALLATVTSGWIKRVHRHGAAVVLAAAATCVAVVLFGLTSDWLVPALLCLGLSGFFDMISGLFRMTIWNQTIPDSHRGRLASVEMISYSTGPLAGNAISGFAASALGVARALESTATLGFLLVGFAAWRLPQFWRYDASARNS